MPVRTVERLADADVGMLGLGALGYDAQPQYNRQTAGKLRKVGMDVLRVHSGEARAVHGPAHPWVTLSAPSSIRN